MSGLSDQGSLYSLPVGLVFLFNLLVGTGALALPKSFQESGLLLGSLTLALSCIISYISATFVVESMAAVNGILKWRRKVDAGPTVLDPTDSADEDKSDEEWKEKNERKPLIGYSKESKTGFEHGESRDSLFRITRRLELSQMASVVIGRWGFVLFQVCLVLYLLGDLAIYSTVVPKSLTSVICSYQGPNGTCTNESLGLDMPCFSDGPGFLSRFTMYRILACAFILLVGPFVFFGLSRTKYIQIFTVITRWLAFGFLIALGTKILAEGSGKGRPPLARFSGFSHIFGISVYAFICHHSLPSLVTPIKQKRHIYIYFSIVYCIVLAFYAALSFTGSFAFDKLQDVYTLNFLPLCLKNQHPTSALAGFFLVVDYFLALFPVFALTTNFPIVGITLRNNLRALLDTCSNHSKLDLLKAPLVPDGPNEGPEEKITHFTNRRNKRSSNKIVQKFLIPFLVVTIPLAAALISDNVEILASVTGSYGGVAIQFVLPSLLVIFSRRRTKEWMEKPIPDDVASPFKSVWWPLLLLLWAVLTVIIVTVNYSIGTNQ